MKVWQILGYDKNGSEQQEQRPWKRTRKNCKSWKYEILKVLKSRNFSSAGFQGTGSALICSVNAWMLDTILIFTCLQGLSWLNSLLVAVAIVWRTFNNSVSGYPISYTSPCELYEERFAVVLHVIHQGTKNQVHVQQQVSFYSRTKHRRHIKRSTPLLVDALCLY